jgi:hypothetical protein
LRRNRHRRRLGTGGLLRRGFRLLLHLCQFDHSLPVASIGGKLVETLGFLPVSGGFPDVAQGQHRPGAAGVGGELVQACGLCRVPGIVPCYRKQPKCRSLVGGLESQAFSACSVSGLFP